MKIKKYTLNKSNPNQTFILITTITNSNLIAQIDHLGELCSLKTTRKEYIWEGNIEFSKHPSPISHCGNFKNNIYQYKDKPIIYRHGFARDIIFELIDKKRIHFCNSIIGCDKKTVPFDFQLKSTIH
jgi:hypothetical protein